MRKEQTNSQTGSFTERVYAIVQNIPPGRTMTYQEVAVQAGSPNAARAVGQIMAKNFSESIPCHRVIRSDGSFGGYNRGGETEKKRVLSSEGYAV